MRDEPHVKEPADRDVEDRPQDHHVPHRGRQGRLHREQPHPPAFQEVVELPQRLGVDDLLGGGLGLEFE
ncbi:MAG: hypothetical protein ACK55I_46265, partial [bacterium]